MPDLQMFKIRQKLSSVSAGSPGDLLISKIPVLLDRIQSGMSVALAVGSRGIPFLPEVVRSLAVCLKDKGAHPFIVPAMGSHGGATAQGQKEILASYGITESEIGAPVCSSMEVVRLDEGELECAVYMDKLAFKSDGVIVVNRVKPHTDYHGSYESGLVKMSVIGLGKHAAALEIHKKGVYGLRNLILVAAEKVFASGKILGGVALLENGVGGCADLEVLPVENIMSDEPSLLERARHLMPRLPLDELDVLVVDRLGKDISGTGLDPNIIGRTRILGESEPSSPFIKSIIITDLTSASHGNALGIGLADIITRKLFEKIDYGAMYENAYTSTFLERVKVPLVAATDRDAFRYALRMCGSDQKELSVMRIRDTLHLNDVYVSASVYEKIASKGEDIGVLAEVSDAFDAEGNLYPF
ncbi:MAG: DUF2088 domain-containing protein [Chitinispirillaceae bacterium]